MTTANTKDRLMRDTAIVVFLTGETGAKNTAFSLDIPENYAMEIHSVDFGISSGVNPVTNRIKHFLVDDPDEDADPGHTAEKVIQSMETLLDVDAQTIRPWKTKDCHRTMLVRNPNFILQLDINPGTTINFYARIWFKFERINNEDYIAIMRQTKY